MKIFVDTNVLIDVLEDREPYYTCSAQVWFLAEAKKVEAFISVISFNNVHYLVRRHVNVERARRAMEILHATFTMVPLDESVMVKAITARITDFEDAIQFFSALSAGVDCIVTRNVQHFPVDTLPVMTPEDFVARWAT